MSVWQQNTWGNKTHLIMQHVHRGWQGANHEPQCKFNFHKQPRNNQALGSNLGVQSPETPGTGGSVTTWLTFGERNPGRQFVFVIQNCVPWALEDNCLSSKIVFQIWTRLEDNVYVTNFQPGLARQVTLSILWTIWDNLLVVLDFSQKSLAHKERAQELRKLLEQFS